MIEDFEPVLIEYYAKNISWAHPDIDILCDMGEDEYNEGVWNRAPLLRLTLQNESKEWMTVIAKSDSTTDLWDKYCSYLGGENDKQRAESEMRSELNKASEDLVNWVLVALLEDTWAPGGEQFCFTSNGQAVGEFFESRFTLSHSPDIGISKEEDGKYYWHT